jgi:hypothetical protein
MMKILKDFPDDVLAIHAEGRVTRKDYDDVLIPAANSAFARHLKLCVYYETGSEFSGFDMGALWKDFTFGVGRWSRWKRVAVVTDIKWLKKAMNTLGFLIPCPMKLFAPNESTQAREWVAESKTVS